MRSHPNRRRPETPLMPPNSTHQLVTRTLMTPSFLFLSALFLLPTGSTAQPTPDSLIRKGKTVLEDGVNRGSIDSLKQARALFKQATSGTEHRALAHYYAALADYRLANQLPDDAEDQKEPVLKDAIDHLKTATDLDPTLADAWALLSGCYGQRMGLDPMRGMSLGPKANDAMSKAKDLAPENPRVWIIDGTSDFFAPSMFGGDKERALRREAVRLFGLFGVLLGGGIVALVLPLGGIWILDRFGLASLSQVLSVLERLDFLLAVTAAGIAGYFLARVARS